MLLVHFGGLNEPVRSVSFAFTLFGLAIASRMEDFQGFQLIVNFVMMPMFFFSGALFPLDQLPMWLRAGVLSFVRSRSYSPPEYKTHKRHEFKKEWWSRTKLTYSWGYVAAFSFAAFWVTGSLDIAFLAFLAYGTHAFVDWLTYGTDFGIRNMVRWARYLVLSQTKDQSNHS